jgi:hypothetical protein
MKAALVSFISVNIPAEYKHSAVSDCRFSRFIYEHTSSSLSLHVYFFKYWYMEALARGEKRTSTVYTRDFDHHQAANHFFRPYITFGCLKAIHLSDIGW